MPRQPCNHREHNKQEALAGRVKYSFGKPWDESNKTRCQCCAAWFQIIDTIASLRTRETPNGREKAYYHYCDLCFSHIVVP